MSNKVQYDLSQNIFTQVIELPTQIHLQFLYIGAEYFNMSVTFFLGIGVQYLISAL